MVYAMVDGMALFRVKAERAAHEMMTVSFDR
jgi:hypothetical protein